VFFRSLLLRLRALSPQYLTLFVTIGGQHMRWHFDRFITSINFNRL
jgi:hypothetical protein